MIDARDFLGLLKNNGVSFYAGVPDSLLKQFGACVLDLVPDDQHIIAANEGAAMALAMGHHLSTGGVGAVYLQNSGLGNLINPLLSLSSEKVYSIPTLLIVGWRGEPGIPDEPQHLHQGDVTLDLLRVMSIPVEVMGEDVDIIRGQVDKLLYQASTRNTPVALVVRKNAFKPYQSKSTPSKYGLTNASLSREQAIQMITATSKQQSCYVATTGMISRELFEVRVQRAESGERDFLTVGGMGHASQIALGIALSSADIEVVCIDGDGASLMHMGSIPIIGDVAPRNLIHFVLNNGVHDSVGGQPTAATAGKLSRIAEAGGYKTVLRIETENELRAVVNDMHKIQKPAFIEVEVLPGHRQNLGRPTSSPLENKDQFMKFLRDC